MVSAAGGIVIAILVLVLVAVLGWVVFTQLRARRLGVQPQQPLRGRRLRAALGRRRPRRGFGPLDPDEAWDARVGHEAETYGPYGNYEEQELGYRGGSGADAGNSYSMNLAATPGVHHEEPARGRSLSRPSDDDALGAPKSGGRNPFEDDAEPSNISLRGVSPRPIVDTASHQQQKDHGESPTERRSIFRENV
ncbi:hypothetical protein ColKHC_05676 [Colletotrichum higginsianum]|nr:hypothetical protein ColKHC_05676 [Colletotrichum higginsianum]